MFYLVTYCCRILKLSVVIAVIQFISATNNLLKPARRSF